TFELGTPISVPFGFPIWIFSDGTINSYPLKINWAGEGQCTPLGATVTAFQGEMDGDFIVDVSYTYKDENGNTQTGYDPFKMNIRPGITEKPISVGVFGGEVSEVNAAVAATPKSRFMQEIMK
ncbi:hypothetical protein KY325_04530, partial [Candidatus Woesearchaeota archaeon]|nr:hypothetical protein [Candidatus Woesearchaeota archaeon]